MSTIYQDQLEVLRRAARALGALPVLAGTGAGQCPSAAGGAAPRVLAEAAAVVTHAGHGTVLKALAAGVPALCLSQGRDQKDNTARVLRLGAGL